MEKSIFLSIDVIFFLIAMAEVEKTKQPKTIAELWTLLQSSFDKLNTKIDDKTSELDTSITELKTELTAKISTNTTNISELQSEVNQLRDEVKSMKADANFRAQRERLYSMKLNQFKLDKSILENETKLKDAVYDKLIVKMLEREVGKELVAVPKRQEVIDILHVLPNKNPPKKAPVGLPQPDWSIPQIQIRFATRDYKAIVCRHKKAVLEELNQGGGAAHLIDDRTPANNKCMAILRADSRVETNSVQIRGTRIRFKRVGQDANFFAKNHFGATLEEIMNEKK